MHHTTPGLAPALEGRCREWHQVNGEMDGRLGNFVIYVQSPDAQSCSCGLWGVTSSSGNAPCSGGDDTVVSADTVVYIWKVSIKCVQVHNTPVRICELVDTRAHACVRSRNDEQRGQCDNRHVGLLDTLAPGLRTTLKTAPR